MDTKELLLTSCSNPTNFSVCLWDYAAGGNVLNLYKNGGIAAPKSLCVLGKDYLLTSDQEKPILHVWQLNSQEPVKKLGTVLPERAQHLAVDPKNNFLAAAIGIKLYLWHLASGELFAIQKKHFQPISCLAFSSDSSCLVTAGLDGVLIVYDLTSLISFHSDLEQTEPVYVKKDHSLPITGLFLGEFGWKSRLATVSADYSCRLYNLQSGQHLLTLIFDSPLTTVIFDNPCWNLFVASDKGDVYQSYLKSPPRSIEIHSNNDLLKFQGHSGKVTAMALNLTGSCLVTGGQDRFVFVWEVRSRQILKRFEHKAEITNLRFVMNFESFTATNFKPKIILKPLQRELRRKIDFVDSQMQDYDLILSDDDDNDKDDDEGLSVNEVGSSDLRVENDRLRRINKQLYDTAVEISRKYNVPH